MPAPARPAVSVVLPFHGTPEEAEESLAALDAIERRDGDELVVVDNTGTGAVPERDGVRVLAAADEHSAYYARNVGADAATNDWLLFVDSDCRPRPDVLDRYFEGPIAEDVGALVGEVVGDPEQDDLVARYARSRGHLGQHAHWTSPFRPWGVTANLLVRRAAWARVGGFQEGVRSGGDTEFSWRLQDDGWRLDYRPHAVVEHRHRDSLRKLSRQAARYAAGRAWVTRRYPGAIGRPKLLLRLGRCVAGVLVWTAAGRFERARFKALDAVFIVSEWAAFPLSNTPPVRRVATGAADVGLVAGTFPAAHDPAAVEAARAVPAARVEAAARPVRVDREAARTLPIAWAEDDGALLRAGAVLWLLRTHPRAAAIHLLARRRPPLSAVAAPARRLAAAGVREVRGLGGAEREAAAIGRLLELPRP